MRSRREYACLSIQLMADTLSIKIYRQLFTDAEWNAIDSAMGDYSDYGDEESAIADSIRHKIGILFQEG